MLSKFSNHESMERFNPTRVSVIVHEDNVDIFIKFTKGLMWNLYSMSDVIFVVMEIPLLGHSSDQFRCQ